LLRCCLSRAAAVPRPGLLAMLCHIACRPQPLGSHRWRLRGGGRTCWRRLGGSRGLCSCNRGFCHGCRPKVITAAAAAGPCACRCRRRLGGRACRGIASGPCCLGRWPCPARIRGLLLWFHPGAAAWLCAPPLQGSNLEARAAGKAVARRCRAIGGAAASGDDAPPLPRPLGPLAPCLASANASPGEHHLGWGPQRPQSTAGSCKRGGRCAWSPPPPGLAGGPGRPACPRAALRTSRAARIARARCKACGMGAGGDQRWRARPCDQGRSSGPRARLNSAANLSRCSLTGSKPRTGRASQVLSGAGPENTLGASPRRQSNQLLTFFLVVGNASFIGARSRASGVGWDFEW
jgi:hypothetical protein